MQYSLFSLLAICAYATARPGFLGDNGRCDQEACQSIGHESGWSTHFSTSWCTSTLTATATVTTTDALTVTDTITTTSTVTTTDAVTTTDTISVTSTCTETATLTSSWGAHGSDKW
ncbi:hypothetical protein N7540_011758 [Penicillium herquei]|nr:hypothetical protein N7540_011758 [Penicillium herquei]